MDKNCGSGVKVTYIETQFVTSDAAGFKDLVQRLTGKGAPVPAAAASPPHRPRPCRAGAELAAAARARPQGYNSYTAQSAAPAGGVRQVSLLEELNQLADFDDLFYVGGSERRRGPHNGGYNDFQY